MNNTYNNPINTSRAIIMDVLNEDDPMVERIRKTLPLMKDGNEYYEFRESGDPQLVDGSWRPFAVLIRLSVSEDRAVYQYGEHTNFKLPI